MNREILIVEDVPVKAAPVTQPPRGPDAENDLAIEDIDYEAILRRNDDIDQLTADYINSLMDPYGDDYQEFESDILEEIENRFEQVLADEFGIYIYRPTILRDDNGVEMVVSSLYGEADEDYDCDAEVGTGDFR